MICFSDCSNKLIAMTLAWRRLQFTAHIWKFAIKISTNSSFVLLEQQYGVLMIQFIQEKNRSTTFFIWDVCILVVRKDGPARKMEFWLILFLLLTTTTTTMPLQHRPLLCPTDQPLLPLVIRDTLCISGRLVLTYQPAKPGIFLHFLRNCNSSGDYYSQNAQNIFVLHSLCGLRRTHTPS